MDVIAIMFSGVPWRSDPADWFLLVPAFWCFFCRSIAYFLAYKFNLFPKTFPEGGILAVVLGIGATGYGLGCWAYFVFSRRPSAWMPMAVPIILIVLKWSMLAISRAIFGEEDD